LDAWSDQDSRWESYGKVIRDARGQSQEMTQVIKLNTLATKFRLSEKEPEHSFIDYAALTIVLKDGSQFVLKPATRSLAEHDKRRLYIPAFRAIEFTFKLPAWVDPADVEQSSLAITGYYETLPSAAICRSPVASSGR
jgi:hypothetical protein